MVIIILSFTPTRRRWTASAVSSLLETLSRRSRLIFVFSLIGIVYEPPPTMTSPDWSVLANRRIGLRMRPAIRMEELSDHKTRCASTERRYLARHKYRISCRRRIHSSVVRPLYTLRRILGPSVYDVLCPQFLQ